MKKINNSSSCNLPYITRIRFEHFYNGILTFDIKECNMYCKVCFSHSSQSGIKFNDEGPSILIPLSALEISESKTTIDEKKIKYLKPVDNLDLSKIIEQKFGQKDEYNNLLIKDYDYGKCVFDLESPEQTINTISQFMEIIKKGSISTFRFSGGEIFYKLDDNQWKFVDWFSKFTHLFLTTKETNPYKLMIETNGTKYDESGGQNSIRSLVDSIKSLISENEEIKDRVHFRISLKNPDPTCYKVLTTEGTKTDLLNAIQLGIYCFKHKMPFHFVLMANYLMIEDLHHFKENLRKNGLTVSDIDIIFNQIEFERLFYYDCVFEEAIYASLLRKELKNGKIKQILNDIVKKDQLKGRFEKFKEKKEKMLKKESDEIANLIFFVERSLPGFDLSDYFIDSQYDGFNQLKRFYQNHKVSKWPKSDGNQEFCGYNGIQKFWQHAFQNRSLFQPLSLEYLGPEITFKDICLIDRIPLFPGIFYLQDFWRQNNPAFFSYALYADSHKIQIEEDTYVFSLNRNPDTYAHTDICRAIPVLVKDPNLINKIRKTGVIHLDSINVRILDITKYELKYGKNIKLTIPFLILELINESIVEGKNSRYYPFLGNIGALFKNKTLTAIKKEYFYLNYFYWTGIEEHEDKVSLEKAFKYLKSFENLGDRKNYVFKRNILKIHLLDVRNDIVDLLSTDKKTKFNNFLDDKTEFKEISKELANQVQS